MMGRATSLIFLFSTFIGVKNAASFQGLSTTTRWKHHHTPSHHLHPFFNTIGPNTSTLYRIKPPSIYLLNTKTSPTITHLPSTTTTMHETPFLNIPSSTTATLSAAMTLITATLFGLLYDKYGGEGSGGGGNVVTLAVAAMLSNVGLAPTSHVLYDISWTRFLPASLALVLLSSPSYKTLLSSSNDDENDSEGMGATTNDTKNIVSAVSVPFLIGSIGSILGCLLSYFVFSPTQPPFFNKFNLSFSLIPKSVMLQPAEAAAAAGCLCASYIGGSVNFFATARILSESKLLEGSVDMSSLLGSMAAADLLVMVIYFASLTAGMKSKRLWAWFPGRDKGPSQATSAETSDNSNRDFVAISSDGVMSGQRQISSQRGSSLITGGLVGALMAWAIVEVSIVLERALSFFVPGTGCAFIAVLGTVAKRILERVQTIYQAKWKQNNPKGQWFYQLAEGIRQTTSPMSDVCFYLLFASIGTSANLSECVRHGPSSLAFAMLALLVHVLFTLYGALCVSKIFPFSRLVKWFPLGLDEVMVASNAAIGGPATAAAFAGKIGPTGSGKKYGKFRHGLIVAATIWGVVGYAVATGVGVTLTKLLLRSFATV